MTVQASFSREPKQERSRASFDRALDAAVSLLVERRSDAFTLAEVAKRAGVSIGSIYGRVDSKDDLIRSAHSREMLRIRDEQRKVLGRTVPMDVSFEAAVEGIIRTVAELLRQQAPVLVPFMSVGAHDAVLAAGGKEGYEEMVSAFRTMLLTRIDDIGHREPEMAVDWSCVVVYGVVARWLGLGSEPEAAGEGDWDQIISNLAEMVTAYLAGPRH